MYSLPLIAHIYRNHQNDVDMKHITFPDGTLHILTPLDYGAYRFLNMASYVSMMKEKLGGKAEFFPGEGRVVNVTLADGKNMHMTEEFIFDPFLKTFPVIQDLFKVHFDEFSFEELLEKSLQEIEKVFGPEKAQCIAIVEKVMRYITYLNAQNILFLPETSERILAVPNIPNNFIVGQLSLYDFEMELCWEWKGNNLEVSMDNTMLFPSWNTLLSHDDLPIDPSQADTIHSGKKVEWLFMPREDGLYFFQVFEYLEKKKTGRKAFAYLEVKGETVRQIDGRG